MARERQKTLPKKERNSSSNIEILNVDKDNNTVLMKINGCCVTAVCRAEINSEIYERVREILVGQLFDGI